MRKCAACGLETGHESRLCAFCRRTKDLIVSRRCVTCTTWILDDYNTRIEGQCMTCRRDRTAMCAGTRWLLLQAAQARYLGRQFALVDHRAAA